MVQLIVLYPAERQWLNQRAMRDIIMWLFMEKDGGFSIVNLHGQHILDLPNLLPLLPLYRIRYAIRPAPIAFLPYRRRLIIGGLRQH